MDEVKAFTQKIIASQNHLGWLELNWLGPLLLFNLQNPSDKIGKGQTTFYYSTWAGSTHKC
jgi:hypothetical protein